MAMTCLAQYPVSSGHRLTTSTAYVRSRSARETRFPGSSGQRKELEDLQARLDPSGRVHKTSKLEDVRAAAEAELDDVHTAADTRVLESEIEHEQTALEEEHKHTTELEDRLAFLELGVESSSTWGSDTTVRLEEHLQALGRRPHFSASRRLRCACKRSSRITGR